MANQIKIKTVTIPGGATLWLFSKAGTRLLARPKSKKGPFPCPGEKRGRTKWIKLINVLIKTAVATVARIPNIAIHIVNQRKIEPKPRAGAATQAVQVKCEVRSLETTNPLKPQWRIKTFSIRLALAYCLGAGIAQAQLIPPGAGVPRTVKPPVVFVEGYQTNCGSSEFSDNFGRFDQLLQVTGRVSLLFKTCAFGGRPSIEELGNDFRDFLAALTYTDGTPVTQVDVVAHSMGA